MVTEVGSDGPDGAERGIESVRLIRVGLRRLGRARRELGLLAGMGLAREDIERILSCLAHACDPDQALESLVHVCQECTGAPQAPAVEGDAGGTTAGHAGDVNNQAEPGGRGLVAGMGAKGGKARSAAKGMIPGSADEAPDDDAPQWIHQPHALDGLVRILGSSRVMGRMMQNRPGLLAAALGGPEPDGRGQAGGSQTLLDAVKAAVGEGRKVGYAQAVAALRAGYYRRLAAIMARDLTSSDPVQDQPAISLALSDLASQALEAALAIACRKVPGSQDCRFAVIGMGKLGARELNYVSDVDLVYVVEPADERSTGEGSDLVEVGSAIAANLQRICQSIIPDVTEPPLWKVDTALRPEGKDGPLVRTLASYRGYYESWAQNWEFQALLKARPVAGDRELGHRYQAMCDGFVWSASQRPNFVYDCQQMRERVETFIPAKLRDREIKLGAGGLRDVEFTVQMLQLVHGRTDPALRVRPTLDALKALALGGYISSDHARRLAADYRFERVIEHRQQMWMLKRTHLFPDLGAHNEGGLQSRRKLTLEDLESNDDLYRLARAFRLHPEELVDRYDRARREVRRLHLAIYFRPMLPIEAQLEDDEVSLKPDAARERFASIGFADPDAAVRHVQALTKGLTRSAKINRILLPAVFAWLGNGQDPDMGLLGWRTLEERFGTKSAYLGFLRDSSSAARRLCHVLANSRYLSAALCKSVESVTWLGDDRLLKPRGMASLTVSCDSYRQRHVDDMSGFADAIRAMRRREIERIGLGRLNWVSDEDACLRGMSDVHDAMIQSALDWSLAAQTRQQGGGRALASMCVIAMGRYGGREVNFSSDADAILIYEPAAGVDDADAASFARGATDKLRTILGSMSLSVEPKVDLDLALRPEGKNGPLVRSLESCRRYYRQWSGVWEHQALLRARLAAGDPGLGRRFLNEVADSLRYPAVPPDSGQLAQVRKLKARMEAERLPRGVRRDRHLKLGAGGLSDVEWTVQLLQLEYAGHCPQLRTTSTLGALHALKDLDLISSKDAKALETGWRLCTGARNGSYLWSGRANQADILPDDTYTLGAMAVYQGYPAHRGSDFANELLGAMRRSREVMARLFYGL
ncbi:bifunctional [glutamine synthetase] adenylyltransferase/[glutamine synthetase]-adenylyl-L-tyrosine phosphorylase [Bifidobacterium xylocopae]|uniref:Bifunctional glutamine-synthetase adenylyltransferase/deadenyltransferase n=1 Tax=Bifidobacterium xylocopae TaxID=2493119 RepID=A0A366KCL9_9BIFI|nr:bifunctional [glutamine synthetase] adenylyltransferase/[glutamine synthetase]-adenylyl-L-tyrosine phosphorylase [Bifidobacterium xylocopae]RBP99319.1 bifunctional glutamine-synthetase adenylyltransferase/deadenyltransferase [Bifidobacterium xylocopae]